MDGDDEHWITMSGTHVLVGEEGTIVGGPSNLKGKQHQPKPKSKQTKAPDYVAKGSEKTYKRCFDEQVKKVSHGKSFEEMSVDEKRALGRMAFNWEEKRPYSQDELNAMDDEALNSALPNRKSSNVNWVCGCYRLYESDE